jgi:hypothetical protein
VVSASVVDDLSVMEVFRQIAEQRLEIVADRSGRPLRTDTLKRTS